MDLCPEQKKTERQTGPYWVYTLLESKSRLRVGTGVSTSGGDAARHLWGRWRQRGLLTPPPLISDSFGGHREALLQVFGRPSRKWSRQYLRPNKGWVYMQLHKLRDDYWRVQAVYPQVVWGASRFAKHPFALQTAYVERTHLTSRLMNARLVRRTLGFSKTVPMLIASVLWGDIVYNLVRPLKSLRLRMNSRPRRWQPRSPAMAAGLTDHLWSLAELLWLLPLPSNT